MDEQRAWIQSRRRKRLRITAVILSICVLVTNYPDIWGTLSAFAEETRDGDGTVYVSDFASLPDKVREQTVPLETGIEELTLPDTLEAFVTEEKDTSGDTEPAPEEEDTSGDTESESEEEDTSGDTESASEEEENADDSEEEETDGDGVTEEPGDTEQEGTEPDATEETEDTEQQGEEQEESDPEEAEAEGDSAPSVQTEDAKLTQESHTVTMPEYQAGNVITVETIENTQETGAKEETVTIEGITWQSEPEFDGNTEGIYIFTAVLPEGYALMEGVSLPQITVTVQADSADSVIQALLDRIAALPDSEAYLAKEPDTEEEEAYAEWMEGLYQYAGEALDIQEAYEALTEEQQALVSEEALAKLTAWVEIAEETVLSSAEVLADHSHPVCGASCSHSGAHGSLNWQSFNSTGGELGTGNYYLTGDVSLQTQLTIPSGTEVNLCLNGYTLRGLESNEAIELNGALTVCDCSNGRMGVLNGGGTSIANGAVIMKGGILNLYGGKLTGNNSVNIIYAENSTINLFGGMVEGGSKRSINNYGGTVIISGDAVVSGGNSSSGCAVQNNTNDSVLTVKDHASLSSEGHGVRSYGTVNIEGGTITSTKTDGYGIENLGGVLNITSGTITGNKYGVYMEREAATLNLSGSPAISGKTAGLYLQTASGATPDNAKVDATGYTGNTLSVTESSTSGREGAYAIKVSEGSKDKFTLTNEGWVYAYKNGGLMIHSHDYTYTASGAVITEKCRNGCGHTATATLTLRDGANLTYTGSEIKPVTVKYSDNWAGTGTEKPDDTQIAYTNNKNAGTATAKLTIASQTASLNFTIASKPLTAGMITLASGSYSYTGSKIEPAVTVKDGGTALVSGTDYTVSYSNNTSVGNSAKVEITGKGNYTGTINKTFAITAADISGATVTLNSTTLTYNGSAQTKGVDSVKIGSTTLTEGTDYTVSGNTKTDAGTYTITITGKGGYAGSTKEVAFTIERKSLTADMVSIASGPYYYNGSGITPAVTVKDGGTALVSGKDYTVSYENNVNVGTGTAAVKVGGTGNYAGTLSETFTIEYQTLPAERLTDYVTISPEPTNSWYGFDITLTPKAGCEVGETPAGTGNSAVIISDETGTDGGTKTIYIKDGGSIYQAEFPYKLDKMPPAVDLTNMTVDYGKKTLWDWITGNTKMIIKIPGSCITESLSGIAEVSYTAVPESGGAGKGGTIPAKGGTYEIALDEEFTGTIQLTVKDKAGHTTQVTLPAENGRVIAEDYPPVITFALTDDTLTPNAGGWYNTAVTIKVTVTDNKDSGSADILSGGLAAIQWKDGADGAVQTVTGLPGTSPVYKRTFSIPAGDGSHTYYVKAVDNAGNVSAGTDGWQSITVKVDTGNPEFSRDITVTNLTKESADITFTSSESGKAYWIVSDTGTAPTAQEVKEQSGQKGGVQDVAKDTPGSFTITGLSAGKKCTVHVVLEDAAGNLSEVKQKSFFTLQEAPNITPGQVTVDYIGETITLPGNIGTVEAYTDPQDPENSKITPNGDGSLPVTPGTAVYIRYPEKSDGILTMPASDSVKIDIPGRPGKPAAKQATVTDTTAAVTNPVSGEEYTLVEKGHTPGRSDWSKANTTGQFDGLNPNQEYDLYVRKKATKSSFASDPVKTEIRTHVAIRTPVIEGDGAGKSGNTAPKPDMPNADGTVTFTGTYGEEYTPVIKAGGQEILPGDGTQGSGMAWDEGKKKGTWAYTLTIRDGAAEAEITVEFRKRAITGIEVMPDALTIYADDAANESLDALTAYVKANSSAEAVYDNKTSGAVQAAYSTTGGFAQKGKAYPYTASAEGKTDNTTLTVKTVSASVAAPDTYMQVQKSGGYTAAEVAAWLPRQVAVTYTGDGYTARTENRTATWNTAFIGAGFGAATGEKTITGTVDLPLWAAGGNSVSMVIAFVDKIVLRDDQIQLSMPGFSYGAQTLPTPGGSVTVADTNPAYTYLYSTDGGATWVTADRLPKSDSGCLIPGEYRVKMSYRGDRYTGGKTASFTVAKKALTVLPGTLAVQDKNYDGTTDAVLKEGGQPALSGVAAGDTVTLGGSLRAAFTEKGPKKNIPVTVTGFVPEGKDAGYYTLKNTTLTLYATINNADGTPPADGEDGGNSGGDRDDHDDDDGDGSGGRDGNGGGDSNTQGNNNGSGTPAATKPVTSPTDADGRLSGTGENSGKKTETKKTPGTAKGDTDNRRKDAAAGNTDPLEPGAEPGGTDTQAFLENGRLVIDGDLIATGNITEASGTRTILKAGDGAVIVTVICEEKSYTAGVKDTVAVANAVLSPEQIQLVNDGGTIEIRVDVTDISETVPGQDKEIIESGLAEYRKERPGLTLGMYVDISMFVRVGKGDWDAVISTAEPIEVVIGIPEELNGDGREFSIIRSHDGAYTLLPDLDDNPDTITISTDLFSAYAIAYEQADKAEMQTPEESSAKCGLCHICPTFLGVCCFIWLAAIIAMLLIVWIVIRRKREVVK